MLIDSHCHLNSLSAGSRESILSSPLCAKLICIDSGIDDRAVQMSVSLFNNYPFIYTAAGFHPFSALNFNSDTISRYEALVEENKKIVAIGEVGLDNSAEVSLDVQEKILRDFIRLSCKKNLPVVLHNRMPDLRILTVLDDFFSSYERVVFHCFSYGEEVLDKLLEKGGMISFSLNILRNKEDIISSLKKCPLEHLLLETDSPYMRIKGAASTPLDVEKVYRLAAEVKGVTADNLEAAIYANAKKIFRFV